MIFMDELLASNLLEVVLTQFVFCVNSMLCPHTSAVHPNFE